jgi:hypothetical protein
METVCENYACYKVQKLRSFINCLLLEFCISSFDDYGLYILLRCGATYFGR